MANEDNSWRTATFRQNIVNKIDEAIHQAGMSTQRNSREMETHVFEKAKTREEYLGFVARLIIHVREARTGLGQGGTGGPGGLQQANATTLLQTLNQRPTMQRLGMNPNVQGQPIPGQMQGQMGGQMGQMGNQMGAQMNNMGGQMGGQMAGQMGGQMTGQMAGQMGGQMTGQMAGQMGGQMGGQMAGQMAGQMGQMGPMGAQMGNQMQRPMGGQMQGPMVQMSVPMGGQMNQINQMGGQLAMGSQMQGQMGGPMGGQMVGQMSNQMGNQMSSQMSMNGQIPNQMQMNGGQLGGQMANQMAAQLGGPGGQMGPNQMNGPMSAQMMNQMNNHMGNQIGGPMGTQMNGPINNQMGNQMQNNLNNTAPNQLLNQMGPQMASQMGNQMHGQMSQMQQPSGPMGGMGMPNSMGPQMGNQIHGQMGSPLNPPIPSPMQNNMHIPQRKGNENAMMNQNFVGPRNQPPNPFLRTSPSPNVQSPAGMGAGPASNQMVSSPVVGLAPSPSSQLGPVPAQQRSVGIALSPGSSINTPGQAQPAPSPLAQPSPDDQAYRDKIKHLSKYIEPLRRMIENMKDGEKMSKMKQLLDLLSNPAKRTQIETLNKCEVVLDKLDFSRYTEQPPAPSPSSNFPPAASIGSLKDNVLFRPLLEAMSTTLQSPMANHTLQRTFGATNQALFGSDLKLLPPPKKKRNEEAPSDIPELLQGEIARLDQRFKVSLDQTQQTGGNSIQLLCWLDDRHLPCVPPVSLTVPDDYPSSPPRCVLGSHDYGATDFLVAVQSALDARMKKLPIRFTVSQLLHTWEMAVRQASAPSNTQPSATTVLLGL